MVPPPDVAKPGDEAAKIWPSIEGTSSCAVLKSFANRFSGSPYAEFANARVYELNCDAAVPANLPKEDPLPKGDPLPKQVAELQDFYYVCCAKPPDDWLSLRTRPRGGREIRQMANGTLLKVIDQSGLWWQIETRDGQSGWAHSNWIKCCKKAAP